MGQDQGDNKARLILYIKVDYDLDTASVPRLAKQLHAAAYTLDSKQLVDGTSAKVTQVTIGVCADARPLGQRHDGDPAVAVVGSFGSGFSVHGPYPDYDGAAEAFDGTDAWITTLIPPGVPPLYDDTSPQITAFLCALGDEGVSEEYLGETLDHLVHQAASEIASAHNNDGVEEQMKFLVHRYSLPDAVALVRERLKDQGDDDATAEGS